mmetsp:Transcript_8894/g.28233  ORF Transcript_8894/g.28233 Transcript_8894/m.28233 type:complete len:115 (-) Transcript_8894:293-637(-)
MFSKSMLQDRELQPFERHPMRVETSPDSHAAGQQTKRQWRLHGVASTNFRGRPMMILRLRELALGSKNGSSEQRHIVSKHQERAARPVRLQRHFLLFPAESLRECGQHLRWRSE